MVSQRRRQLSPKEAAEKLFARKYSRFKLWISFKDGNNADFFEYEAYESVLQIEYKRVTTVHTDARISYDRLFALVDRYRGKFKTAIIYDQYRGSELADGTRTRGYMVAKFISTGDCVEWEEIDMSNPITQWDIVWSEDQKWSLKRKEPLNHNSVK
jgi:hypothetical protein